MIDVELSDILPNERWHKKSSLTLIDNIMMQINR